ncbi:FAD-dependent oxidoreductase, partial [Clostridium perfringens]|uniref:FAD-dependent oxidoreductase n=1 Tax=Clostridium perfringens TaxID=1502 RepID=UPI003D2FDD08
MRLLCGFIVVITSKRDISMMEEQTDWDIVVIGGGVVGCAVFRQFCLMGARTLLLEKGGDILSGASKANSALLHT